MNKLKTLRDLTTLIENLHIQIDEPLYHYTFTKTGGNADILVFPKTYEQAQKVIQYTIKHDVPYTILGNGSNLIIRDGGIRGIVLNLTHLSEITCLDTFITAQSGATIIDTSRMALENHLTGLEFACGIPGSVGGACFMNAGAYNGEISNVLNSVLVLDKRGELLRLTRDDLHLEYRNSSIAKNEFIVLEAVFELTKGNYEQINSRMEELTTLRKKKQPLEYPSCGSVFKRPPNMFAGKLIQDAGLQGTRVGGAEVSKKHAGFIVNVDHATASDYLNLIQLVQQVVKDKFNVELETEVKIIGESVS